MHRHTKDYPRHQSDNDYLEQALNPSSAPFYGKRSYRQKNKFDYHQSSKNQKTSKLDWYISKVDQNKMIIPEHTRNLINDLLHNKVECMVCNDTVKKNQPVWSCSTCFTIFHLKCIDEWIKKKNNLDALTLTWTCPHCNHEYTTDDYPKYDCYCKKFYEAQRTRNKHLDPELIPHGCGLFCGKKICQHITCPLPCHPGPHVQCKEMIEIKCYCGANGKTVQCAVDMEMEYSCGSICGKQLNCGKINHTCKMICHKGSCEQYLKNGKCYECIGESRDKFYKFLKEVETKLRKECYEAKELTHFASALTQYIFTGELPCGEHSVEVKTDINLKLFLRLFEISGDNLLNNLKTFIPICQEKVENCCNCKSKTSLTDCFKLNYPEDLLDFLGIVKEKQLEKCTKVCKTLKNCRIHRCERVCCELRDVQITNYSLQDPMGYHLCMQLCGKLLTCGVHKCENYCHRGNCKPCAYIIHEGAIYCTCKRTKIEAPYICGTKVECNYPCSAPRTCEHPCPLKCHEGPCPPCEYLTFKHCRCGKNLIKDVKCGNKQEIICDTKCDMMLNCGVHFCEIKCHNHTEEYDLNYKCVMTCNRQLVECEHLCKMKCHGESDCDEYLCEVNVAEYCKCHTVYKWYKCGELKKIKEKEKDKILVECGEECVRKERLRNIEEAFKGLSQISDEKVRLLYPNYNPDGNEEFKKEIPLKYDWDTISKAQAKIEVIMKFEQELYRKIFDAKNEIERPQGQNEKKEIKPEEEKKEEAKQEEEKKVEGVKKKKSVTIAEPVEIIVTDDKNVIRKQSVSIKEPEKETKPKEKEVRIQIDKEDYEMISEWLIIYHSLNPKMLKIKDNAKRVYIVFTSSTLKRFYYQKYRLSLIALLLKYNKFAENKKIPVYHPFNYSILIRNYKSNTKYEGVEACLLAIGKMTRNDFYLDEFKPNEFYVHFFDSELGHKVYLQMKTRPIEFQEAYETSYPKGRDLKEEKLYSYYKDEEYFSYLNEELDGDYPKRFAKGKKEEENEKSDDDGFIEVKTKKRHKKK